jgi:hypothetical protein
MSANPSLALFQQSWIAPQQEHTAEQNEDARRVELSQHTDRSTTLLIAISDGASGAVYSRLWARTLVEAARLDWPILSDAALDEQLSLVRQSFKPVTSFKDVPWYVQTKIMTEGSQAALLVAAVRIANDAVEVRAVSVGDSCLLLFRRNDLQVMSFPVGAAADFGLNPALVRSLPRPIAYRRLPPTCMQQGDLLIVCTDAVGKWVMECLELGLSACIFDVLIELLSPAAIEHAQQDETPPGHMTPVATTVQAPTDSVTNQSDITNCSQRWGIPAWSRLLRRLWFSLKSTQPEPSRTVTPTMQESDPASSVAECSDAAAVSAEPTTAEPADRASLKFSSFVSRYRSSEAKPRMRDDDATLILCLPVWEGNSRKQRQAALAAVRDYQAAAARLPLGVRAALINQQSTK